MLLSCLNLFLQIENNMFLKMVMAPKKKKDSIAAGVPQGNVLGPFFLVYVKDLALRSEFDTLIYADDTVSTISSNTILSSTEITKFELGKVQK